MYITDTGTRGHGKSTRAFIQRRTGTTGDVFAGRDSAVWMIRWLSVAGAKGRSPTWRDHESERIK
jgi:hypothetical protein